MGANYGGTEIRQALQYALDSISINMPTAVFVLTDGEVRISVDTMMNSTDLAIGI